MLSYRMNRFVIPGFLSIAFVTGYFYGMTDKLKSFIMTDNRKRFRYERKIEK